MQFKPSISAIPLEALEAAVAALDGYAIKDFANTGTMGELLLHAFHLHESGKHEAAHISAWTIAERCLNDLWRKYLADREAANTEPEAKEKFIGKERKKTLTGRDYTASIISEALSLADVISFRTYQQITAARQARNKWMHKTVAIDRTSSYKAIRLAQRMLADAGVLELAIPFREVTPVPIAYAP